MSEAGWQAWDILLRCSGQLRFAPGGAVLGIDISLALSLAATLDYDGAAVAELLPAAEGGMLEGLARLRKENP